MKVLIAPDKFKGSMSAGQAAQAIARGLAAVWPDAQLDLAPIADGGEGFAAALCTALEAQWITLGAHDALGRTIEARYAWSPQRKLAVIELSEASGLWRLAAGECDALRASTFGTGELMADAMQRGAETILVGLGGSATTDGGIGIAAALGFEFLTGDGQPLQAIPLNLTALSRIRPPHPRALPAIIAACDVQSPLLGPRGTARMFSPQKGADLKTVETLERCMETLADVAAMELDCDFRDTPGAGAAGGAGFGLMTFCQASIRSGFEVVAEVLQLPQRIRAVDLVVTGEGRLDEQTLEGKGPAGVSALARSHGKPSLALAGSLAEGGALDGLFTAVCGIVDQPLSLQQAIARGPELLERAATRAARLISLGKLL